MRTERKERLDTLERLAKMSDATSEDQKVIDTIDKLLKLAAKAGTQAEAENAMARANEWMEKHNLSMAAINEGSSTKKASKRTDEKLKGGLYQFQRDMWEAVAKLNFCWYFNQYERDFDKISPYWIKRYGGKVNVPEYRRGGYVFRHRLVGRAVNVAATISMCGYLESAIERIVRERLGERNLAKAERRRDEIERHGEAYTKEGALWGEWAVKFREGIADTVCEKLAERRRGIIRAERQKHYEAQAAAAAASSGDHSTSTALSLGTITEQEHADNYDFLYGEGEYAAMMAQRAARAERRRIEAERYAAWAAANPEEAKAEEEERRKESRRFGHTPWNAGMGKSKYDSGAYHAGREAGKAIGLDPQTGGGARGQIGSR